MEVSRSNHHTRRARWAWAVRGASGVALATAVSAASAADGPRAAALLPPRVGAPAPANVVARGAADDNPLATTPVVRRPATPPARPAGPGAGGTAPAPDWLSGVDPNVLPAGGSVSPKAAPARLASDARPFVTPPPSPRLAPPPMPPAGEPGPLAKGVGALKGFITPDAQPQPQPQADARSPGEPLQGTSASGAPVLAGPPAWRWYGYGSVTPGANPYAPGGQYPRASSNWYSVTRATPGAFPVPVVNPYRSAPGSEPPSYAGTPAPTPTPRPAAALPGPDVFAAPPPARLFPTPEPAGATKFGPAPVEAPTIVKAPTMPFVVPVPTMTTPPPVAAAPPVFAPVPLPPPPAARMPEPVVVAPPARMPEPVSVAPPAGAKMPEPVSVIPPAVVPVPPAARMPAPVAVAPPAEKEPGPRTTAVPVPVLPPASAAPAAHVTVPAPAADEIRWQANPDRAAPAPAGTWLPPADRSRPGPGPGASVAPRLPVARAQAGDEVQQPADPVLAVVEAVCRGRAAGVDVRHTGPRRVTVCFETRTQTDAAALVRDLSARPELAPYEINFCVLVK